MTDWEAAWGVLKPCFDGVIAKVKACYPDIKAAAAVAPVGYEKFGAYASFCYDPAYQEFEDLLLWFTCAPTRSFRAAGGALKFPDAAGRDLVRFAIERGTGEMLAALDPVLLPEDEDAPEYEAMVMDYVAGTVAFAEENTDLILEALRTRYRA